SNGVSPYFSRTVSSVASSLQILPMNLAIPNSTYNLTFNGPSFRCNQPSPKISDAIYAMLNQSTFSISSHPMTGRYDTGLSWMALAPSSVIPDATNSTTNFSLVS